MLKLLFIFALLFYVYARAEDLDSASKEALSKTQQLMKTKTDREKYFRDHPEAQAADKKVDGLTTDPKLKDKMYDTSSDIFEGLVKETSGDPNKQKEILDQAAKDPEGFFNHLSPDQQKQVRDLAGQIEKTSPINGPAR